MGGQVQYLEFKRGGMELSGMQAEGTPEALGMQPFLEPGPQECYPAISSGCPSPGTFAMIR
jgi:hypothetical protein